MAQPVWVLSVDLQTKTATFQSGMAEAAKTARAAFTDIEGGSSAMNRTVGVNMFEARHGVMLLAEEFGVHLPRALTSFIADIGPVGAALEAAFPFLAIAVGATLLITELVKLHEAGEKLTSDQMKFGTAVQVAFNSLDEKLLQAGIKSDELKNNHLGALKKQLELIDKQSMAELSHQFDGVAKHADALFAGLQGHWYTFGIGATGAKHALDTFQAQYASLLAQGKSKDAGDLLAGTRQSAIETLDALKKVKAAGFETISVAPGATSQVSKDLKDWNILRDKGLQGTEAELAAQETLLQALNAQVGLTAQVAQLNKDDKGNAKTEAGKAGEGQAAAAARAAAESAMRINMQMLEADKAMANARLTIQHASIAERTQSDIGFADAELRIQLQGNAALMAALDKGGKDYANNLKAAHEHAAELVEQHTTHVAEITAKGTTEQNARDLADLEGAMREAISATETGSAQRLSAINSAITVENALNLSSTRYFKELQVSRVEALRQAAADEEKLRAEAGAEAADNDEKIGALIIAAAKEHQQLLNSLHRVSAQEIVQQETLAAEAQYQILMTKNAKEIAALDKHGKDYENKLKALQNKETQLTQAHENQITAIKEKAETERNTRILAAESSAYNSMATGLTQSIMGHETWAKMVLSFGNQAVEGMIKNSLLILAQQDKEKLGDAKKAATSAYTTGEKIGGPAGIVLGPIFAAAAFAGVMAFEEGGVVPGFGRGDTVPAMLTPGEGIVPGGLMDGLRKMVDAGGTGGNHYHIHAKYSPVIHAVDGAGVDRMLDKHGDKFQRHLEKTARKLNR